MRIADSDNSFRAKQRRQVALRRLSPLMTFLLLLLLWQWVTQRQFISQILVPAPADVYAAFARALADGSLAKHTMTTLGEMIYGLGLGVGIGLLLGYAIAKAPLLEYVLSPIIVAFQSTPIVAYAPLLVIWFGTGPTSKVVTTAVIVFFPTLVNAIVGIRSVSPRLRDLMRSLNAGRWRTFRVLELPSCAASYPRRIENERDAGGYRRCGRRIRGFGQWFGCTGGHGAQPIQHPLVVVAVLTMTAIALTLYSLVALVEWRFLVWQRRAAQ